MKRSFARQPEAQPEKCLAVEMPVSDYHEIHRLQLDLVSARHTGTLDHDVIFILEHHPVFTIGRHGSRDHLIADDTLQAQQRIPVVRIERGGQITYHGPGQVVGYPIIHLRSAGVSVKDHVNALEEIMIRTASDFGVAATRNPINPGVWVKDQKLGSVGIAVRHGITFHGFALNVNLVLTPFDWINPCGLVGVRMTSLAKERNQTLEMKAVRERIWHHVAEVMHRPLDFVGLSGLPGVNSAPGLAKRTVSAKPKWLRRRLPSGPSHEKIRNLIVDKGLHTVCQQAKCPNQFECFSQQTATFLILGDRCTRNCRFCNISPGPVAEPDPNEPKRVAQAARKMGLTYVVVTSVTRDDLPDGGAAHFAETIRAIRKAIPNVQVEVLIPDFQGAVDAIATVLAATPDVLNHNVETVSRLYSAIRPQARYDRSLELLRYVSDQRPDIAVKSGIMLGLGETDIEIRECLTDIYDTGCRMLTLGQYLQPSLSHLPVARFVPPHEFEGWREAALKTGFSQVASGPFVRSSYHAKDLYRKGEPCKNH